MAKAKSVAIVPSKKSTAIIDPATMEDWEKDLLAKATDAKASEVVGIPQIKHRGGVLKIDDKKIEGNKLKCVVVTYGLAKKYFENGFDPDAPAASPVCYAFALPRPGAEGEMVPHTAAPDKQHETCAGCPHNVFGTAEKGRGKRCNDVRKVLVIVGNEDPASVAKAQVRQIEVPKGSLRTWGNYLKSLDEVTPYGVSGVVTEISAENLETGGYMLTFSATDRLDRDFVKAVFTKAKQLEGELSQPYPVLDTTAEKPAKKGGKKVKGQD